MILPVGAKKRQSSFTLIELILVILLISILIGLSTPLFKRTFSGLQLKNTTFNITKIINYAQEIAIVERVNYKVNFDFEEGNFWITKLDESGDIPVYKRIGGRHGRIFLLPRELIIAGKKEEIILYPDGRSDEVEIKIIDKSGESRLLRVKGFGNQIEIEESKE